MTLTAISGSIDGIILRVTTNTKIEKCIWTLIESEHKKNQQKL